MAEGLIMNDCFSAELRILEADYEKSKLLVYQDTLICKRSIVELELLCKKEQLQRKARENDKLQQHECRLEEQLNSLTSELKDTNNQLQTAQNTLQNEQTEKKDLEDKLSSDLARVIEEHTENARQRENLLQEEIKNWQDKHVQAYKEVEELRTELERKNVEIKSKAIQTEVIFEEAPTMAQIVPETCDVGVQARELPPMDDLSRRNDEQAREIYECTRGTNETGKGRKAGVEEKTVVEERQATLMTSKGGRKGKVNLKNSKQDKKKNKAEQEVKKISRKRKTSQEEVTEKVMAAVKRENSQVIPQKDANDSSPLRASKDHAAPFLCTKTPRRLQRSSEEANKNQSECDSLAAGKDCGTTEETREQSEKTRKEFPQPSLVVCIEDISEKRKTDKAGESKDVELEKEVAEVSEVQLVDEKVKEQVAQDIDSLHEDTNVVLTKEDENSDKTAKSSELGDQQNENRVNSAEKQKKQKRTTRRKGNNKKNETENANLDDKMEVENVKSKAAKKCKNRNKESGNGRVLRDRAKKRANSNETQAEIYSKKTRQKASTNNMAVTKNNIPAKNLACDLAFSNTSSPEEELLSRQTKLSSRDPDRFTDVPHPAGGLMSDGTSQQPETEVPGEFDQSFESVQSNPLRDYESVRESLSSSSDNRMKKSSKENVNRGSFESASEEIKSSSEGQLEEKSCLGGTGENHEPPSKNCRRNARTETNTQDATSCTERSIAGSDTRTRLTAENASSDDQKTEGDGHKPAGPSTTDKMATDEKENTVTVKTTRKKRKPTTSKDERLVSASQQTSTEMSSILDCTKKRKTLFNARDNSFLPPCAQPLGQVSFANTTLSRNTSKAGIPPSLSAFVKNFIAPKLKKAT